MVLTILFLWIVPGVRRMSYDFYREHSIVELHEGFIKVTAPLKKFLVIVVKVNQRTFEDYFMSYLRMLVLSILEAMLTVWP